MDDLIDSEENTRRRRALLTLTKKQDLSLEELLKTSQEFMFKVTTESYSLRQCFPLIPFE